ncbi:MAG: HD-GYP domain-containing protein [Nostocoides sp.]
MIRPIKGPPNTALRTWLFIGGTVAAAVALLVACLWVFGIGDAPWSFMLLTGLVALVRGREISELGGRVTFSMASVLPTAGVLLNGPGGAALFGVLAGLLDIGRVRPRAMFFNTAMYSLMGSISGLTYWSMNGDLHLASVERSHLLKPIIVPFFVALLIMGLVNAVLVSAIMRVNERVPFRTQALALISSTGVPYAVNGVLALLIALLWLPVGLRGYTVLLMAAPVMTGRWAFTQYGDERVAHERTVSSLVGALEAKAPAMAGQGAAVGEVSRAIATEMGMSAADIDAVATAGTLHDLGLLALPTALMDPEYALTAEDRERLREHPSVAVTMLQGISFVQGSLDAIAYHHARIDGTGYPEALSGLSIPVGARVVAVADAFVALRTPRVERPALTGEAALARIDRLAGTAFDPRVVAVLDRLVREGVTDERLVEGPTVRCDSALGHDEPVGSPPSTGIAP